MKTEIELQPGRFYLANKFDYSLTQSDLGFVYEYTLEKGVKDFIAEVRKEEGLA